MLVAVLAAAVVAGLVFFQARDRVESDTAGGSGYDVVITASQQPIQFEQSSVWWIDGAPGADFFGLDDGTLMTRINSQSQGTIVGLEDADRRLVGLSLLPPGLDQLPGEFQVSPESTALAVVGLHPDVLTNDPDTYLARLVVAAGSPGFADLAARVDGDPIESWGSAERDALNQTVAAVAAAAKTEPSCADAEALGGSLIRCPGSDSLQNLGRRAQAVFDEAGQFCAIVSAATERVSDQARGALGQLVSGGVGLPNALDAGHTVTPGEADVGSACGSKPRAVVDSVANPDWEAQAGRMETWIDDAAPLAWALGAAVDHTDDLDVSVDLDERLAATGSIVSGSPSVGDRFRAATTVLKTPDLVGEFGLAVPIGEAVVAIEKLAGTLGGLY